MKDIRFEISLPVSILREEDAFIAYTPALDLSTSGKSYEEAKRRFIEIVEIFFEEIIKKGAMEEVLQNLGWSKREKQWMPPLVVSHELETIRVRA